MSLLRMDHLDGETREKATRLLQVRLRYGSFVSSFFGNSKKCLSGERGTRVAVLKRTGRSVLYPMSTAHVSYAMAYPTSRWQSN